MPPSPTPPLPPPTSPPAATPSSSVHDLRSPHVTSPTPPLPTRHVPSPSKSPDVLELSNNDIPKLVDKPPATTPPATPLLTIPDPPIYPQLSNNPPASPDSRQPHAEDDKDEEPSVPQSFDRGAKPERQPHIAGAHEEEDGTPAGTRRRMHKFTLYETTTRYYIVGSDILDSQFRILKIDRTADEGDLSITEDEVVYSHQEMGRLLSTIEDGNRSTGGLRQKTPFWGLLGFIRFTGAYYMLLVTKRSVVAMIGGHYVYQIDATELVPLTTEASKKPERNSGEARFVSILGNLDLTRSFYFSYSYDITRTLQHNIIRQREHLVNGLEDHDFGKHDFNDMFVWNHYLLQQAKVNIKNTFDWCMPIVHGYVDQANISVYGRSIYITIIARRSRYFAGARFLKRGANDLGYVANDVETEQIVSDMLTTSFHAPGKKLYANPNYTSYVQHRGSIPLFWTQKNDAATPKPPVEMNLVDPFFSAAALHFDDLFARYGAPVIVLNLVKSKERTPRESKLLKEFTEAVGYLNQFLPEDKRIRYIAWDMSRAAKSRDQDVIETLETIAENVLATTGFFHNGPGSATSPTTPSSSGVIPRSGPSLQNGVCRTNCIDCLDRTNAAQFVLGKRALAHQLHALGVIAHPSLAYDTDAVDLFTHMYHDHGDTIAVQYAGSHLVNTMETYRKINQWTSHPRDMLESFKRYYNNSFLDGQRQEAYNLFLGNYIFAKGQPMLWDLSTDYYLHHNHPRASQRRRSYTQWWTPRHLAPRTLPAVPALPPHLAHKPYAFFDDYWIEYYRPLAISSFWKVFSFKLNSTIGYIPIKMTRDGTYDLSPFVVRSAAPPPPERRKKKPRKSIVEFVGFADPLPHSPVWPPAPADNPATPNPPPATPALLAAPAVAGDDTVHTIMQSVARSLNPVISDKEQSEYELWLRHHLDLPLVTTAEPAEAEVKRYPDLVDYVRGWRCEAGECGGYEVKEEDRELYRRVVEVPAEPLRVEEEDGRRRRFVAYGRWVVEGRFRGRVGEGVGRGE